MPAPQDLIIVNASPLLTDEEVHAKVGPLQKKFDRDFHPAWQKFVPLVKIDFAPAVDIPKLPRTCWPVFLNRHSKDPGALGWHDDDSGQNVRTYSRVFVGDCIRLNLDWGVTLSHEVDEMILDPNIHRVWRMPNGELAALEACDPVEDDSLGYRVDGVRMSNFVLPQYFSTNHDGPWDFRKALKGPCPALTAGGYQSITRGGRWTQIFANMGDHMPSARYLMNGHRRASRGQAVSPNARIFKGDLG